MTAGGLVSVDPGVNGCGYAIGRGQAFVTAGYMAGEDTTAVFHNIVNEATRFGVEITEAVIELPQTYKGRAALGDANNLIRLALVVGRLSAHFETLHVRVALVWPHDWKGTTPKDITAQRCAERLGAAVERVQLPLVTRGKRKGEPNDLAHNVWDAVGIWFWAAHTQRGSFLARWTSVIKAL